ncbi:hypothetical protein [Sphingobacterium chuzhouense]|uniref:MlpB protein n=1 Tax=Sphingobacterium chuzhouense TaxID=1742264 RepID=A0ABR7XSZ6_9SPHI|nr:hypothetical protein [Sphingobacterium chuzhouense]MBD1422305.1 hypothetical protein [Sphingobacterium chuzhouense]
MKTKFVSIVAVATVLFIGCNQTNSSMDTAGNSPKKGDHVPGHLVCMVNDAYMGKQQLEVPFEGKMYYGCCKMCQERIPKDGTVRYAIDPHTLERVDKATAYIVMISDGGEVAYFENEDNYKRFVN